MHRTKSSKIYVIRSSYFKYANKQVNKLLNSLPDSLNDSKKNAPFKKQKTQST